MSHRRGSSRKRPRADQYQLALPLAWLAEAELIDSLERRGIPGIRRVRFRPNRSRLISLTAHGSTLNLHECFRSATDAVLDAIAAFLRASPGTAEYRRSVQIMRLWSEGQAQPDASEPRRSGAASVGTAAQRAFLSAAYGALNRDRFGGQLPDDVPIRISPRMVRRFGHVEYGPDRDIAEIALSIDLFVEGNERHLLDTLLHEMAHVEAWVVHGHRGHGLTWRRIARRVGCEVHATSRVRIRRRNGMDVTRIPAMEDLLAAEQRSRRASAARSGRTAR